MRERKTAVRKMIRAAVDFTGNGLDRYSSRQALQ